MVSKYIKREEFEVFTQMEDWSGGYGGRQQLEALCGGLQVGVKGQKRGKKGDRRGGRRGDGVSDRTGRT